jgi:hypothetical protein
MLERGLWLRLLHHGYLGSAQREFSKAWGNLSILDKAQRPAPERKWGAGFGQLPGSSDR